MANPNWKDWSRLLEDAIWAYSTAYQTSLGMSPYKIIFVKQSNMAYDRASKERKLQLKELEELRLEAYKNSQIFKKKVKKFHDKQILRKEFRVGQKVLLFNSHLKLITSKLHSRWDGPFVTTNVFSQGAVELKDELQTTPSRMNQRKEKRQQKQKVARKNATQGFKIKSEKKEEKYKRKRKAVSKDVLKKTCSVLGDILHAYELIPRCFSLSYGYLFALDAKSERLSPNEASRLRRNRLDQTRLVPPESSFKSKISIVSLMLHSFALIPIGGARCFSTTSHRSRRCRTRVCEAIVRANPTPVRVWCLYLRLVQVRDRAGIRNRFYPSPS
ncbi:hypothetical protein CR513_00040, partial [Mucuna pruriens]